MITGRPSCSWASSMPGISPTGSQPSWSSRMSSAAPARCSASARSSSAAASCACRSATWRRRCAASEASLALAASVAAATACSRAMISASTGPRRHQFLDLQAPAIQLLLRGGETLLHLAVALLGLLAGAQSPDQPAQPQTEEEGEQHPEEDLSGDVEHGSDSLDDELDAAVAGLVLGRVVGYQRILLAAAEGGEVVGGHVPIDEVVLDGVGPLLAELEVGLG